MSMERRALIAIGLSLGLLVLWQVLFPPPPSPEVEPTAVDSAFGGASVSIIISVCGSKAWQLCSGVDGMQGPPGSSSASQTDMPQAVHF